MTLALLAGNLDVHGPHAVGVARPELAAITVGAAAAAAAQLKLVAGNAVPACS